MQANWLATQCGCLALNDPLSPGRLDEQVTCKSLRFPETHLAPKMRFPGHNW
jgi:hypothetical protein